MNLLADFLGRNGHLPLGDCFTWSMPLLWSRVGADAVIAAACFAVPLAIVTVVRHRADSSLRRIAWLFCAFILACGVTHLMDIWTIWQPDYGLQAIANLLTAAISITTAFALWPVLPKALKIPSVQQLQAVIRSLEREIETHRATAENLVDMRHNLAFTLASIGAGFIATDRAGRVTRMNAVAERITGWTESEARGHDYREVFVREGRPPESAQRNPVDLMIEQQQRADTLHRVVAVSRSGVRTALDVNASVVHGADGAPRGLGLVFRDMTRLNRAETESNLLAAIVESSNDAIIGKTLDGRITSWNGAAEALFGYRAAEAIGQPVQMLIPPERADEEMRILSDVASGRRVAAFDTLRRAKDGRLVEVSITISPIRDAHGVVIGASKIARDISMQRRAETALRESETARLKADRLEAENRQIQEANRLKSQFLANMSHELRTPLNAIIGFADLLHTGAVPPDSPKLRTFVGHIGTSGRHLLQLINDVLDLSKVESGKFEFFPEPIDLRALVGDVRDIVQAASQRKRIAVTVEVDPSLTDLVLDPVRLKQVLYNYLSNAVKFTPEGGRVAIRALPEGPARFRIEVEDDGIGIAAADLPRLFTEFQQLDASLGKQHQGTGLGLALTRRLVEAQGGSVGVRSTPGRGSVFHLVLKRAYRPAAAAPADGEPARNRMLVIADDRHGRTPLVAALAESGYEVDAAGTGAQALQRAFVNAYDAITLGLQLPDQSGLRVLASIRDYGPNRTAPVVGMTMAGDGDAGAAAFAIADVLTKPIRLDEIAAALDPLRRNRPRRAKVMVVDDDPIAIDLMRVTLMSIEIDCVGMLDGRRALRELDQHRPDALILDLMIPQFDGFAVLDALRRMPSGQELPVYIWTAMLLTDEEYAHLARSARAIIGKGGGALPQMLSDLRRWRPPLAAASDGNAR